MHLKAFRVTNFRSVRDSGWVEADKVTALIGVNESGKTNLLLPLWKLNPARDGEIQATSDYPKSLFSEIRVNPEKYCFIEADFLTNELKYNIKQLVNIDLEEAAIVRVHKYFDGSVNISFPLYKHKDYIDTEDFVREIKSYSLRISKASPLKQEGEIIHVILTTLQDFLDDVAFDAELRLDFFYDILEKVEAVLPSRPARASTVVPLIIQVTDYIRDLIAKLSLPVPEKNADLYRLIRESIPKFVYYSNYGNLDSEIYLPHVVDNMQRDDLGSREAAKARTLKVLFKFVKIEPHEILNLGQELGIKGNARPNEQDILDVAEKKKTRSILLQSASTLLTQKFRDWWRQGDYRFRFEADGNHFRIWVADDRRPTEVELESRSTGLQWFLSFYLVFLVESAGDHQNAILLLDEPGMSLHPLAQRDLSSFFDSLADTNQILYTSHSPFLVDADRLERARKVYVAADGTTKATANLRYSEGKDEQSGAAYAVYSALNLSVSESLLVGCNPILVEGASDQHYMSAIKALLLSGGKIKPKRELVFPPCGGTKTARAVASILTGRDDDLPIVFLDNDFQGKRLSEGLKSDLYSLHKERIISVGDFVDTPNAEIEDLFPVDILAEEMDRMEKRAEVRLADIVRPGVAFVSQVEKWSQDQSIEIDPHWKVLLAVNFKKRALSKGIGIFSEDTVERWVNVFTKFL